MIARYTRPEMAKIWSEAEKYRFWLQVERAVCEEQVKEGLIPLRPGRDLCRRLQKLIEQGGVNPERVEAHEKIVRHDVIAFTAAVAEKVGPLSRYVHFGLTSSDVIDTAFALQVNASGAFIREGIQKLLFLLKKKALRYQKLPSIGRSHGVFAEPTAFGLKFLSWYCEWQRNLRRLDEALQAMSTGKLSGAVGVSPHWGVNFEARVLHRLGLKREPVSTQVIPRDRHAELLGVLALCGSSLERIAIELRHLQRSEVGEVMEGFQKGQKGSSAMPHKRNPISSENLTGCARLLRSYAQAAHENVALWHERDISHSSVERVIFPDSFILLDYALDRMTQILESLVVREDRVLKHVRDAGTAVFSGHFLLALAQAGATREQAYAWIQQCALGSLEGEGDFVELMKKHPRVRRLLSSEKLKDLGSLDYQLRHVLQIYHEVLGKRRAGKRLRARRAAMVKE